MTQKRSLLLGSLCIVVIILILVLAFDHGATPNKVVIIKGIPECSKDIDQDIADHLNVTLYGYVTAANDYNKIKSMDFYKGNTRDATCRQDSSQTVTTSSGGKIVVITSSVIVDIPAAKQSWRISYDWTKQGEGDETDLGALRPSCLTSKDLHYGAFNCQKVLNIQKYGTPNYDPILKYVPYTGDGFSITYDPDTRGVIATIIVPSDQKDNQELIENNKAVIPYWFSKRGLDITKYTVTYRTQYGTNN